MKTIDLILREALLAALALMPAACADCPQDPSEAGFVCGVKNIADGTYERRQLALTSGAEQAEAEARRRSDRMRVLHSQEANLAAEKKDLHVNLASLQVDLDRQKRELAEARLRQQIDRSELAQLEKRVNVLQDTRDRLVRSGIASRQDIEALKREIQHLQNRIDEVLDLTVVE